MAKERKGEFPVVGDRVLAEDGSVWLCTKAAEEPDGPVWEQQEPAVSVAELDQAEDKQKGLLDRLSADHRVYALAFGGVKTVKREADLNDTDPKEAFVLALATSALRDSIIAVTSEDHERSDLEARTASRLRSFLGDPEMASVNGELVRLRAQIADETTPDGVTAKAREPLTELAELAGKLPPESDARKTITAIATSRKPMPETPDKLFRELITMGVDVETASKAQGAAHSVVKAYG